ncbi:unnamed protein product [Rotaria magnacalcarata]|uniref:Uncharacterized protein n=1 Tax=Rotaria magnacalcarata TaxID=392030 RepID=A0A816R174_9BILA|nr:unnamed protein product [Rotaria magnacalcarata]
MKSKCFVFSKSTSEKRNLSHLVRHVNIASALALLIEKSTCVLHKLHQHFHLFNSFKNNGDLKRSRPAKAPWLPSTHLTVPVFYNFNHANQNGIRH